MPILGWHDRVKIYMNHNSDVDMGISALRSCAADG